jgi:hypothetical protein
MVGGDGIFGRGSNGLIGGHVVPRQVSSQSNIRLRRSPDGLDHLGHHETPIDLILMGIDCNFQFQKQLILVKYLDLPSKCQARTHGWPML